MTKTENPVGRPPHEPNEKTRAQVEMMVGFGNTQEQIAAIVGISEPTLRAHYRTELNIGMLKTNNAVAMNLFRQATKPDPRSIRAAEFWLRCRAGWSEYSPPPAPPKDPPLGKKEMLQIEAETAEKGTDWSNLVH